MAFACVVVAALCFAPGASAKSKYIKAATYPDQTQYQCRTDAIPIHPGQNLNLLSFTSTCPNAHKVAGPGSKHVFDAGSTEQGFITRFKPSMVELKPSGKLVTPSVWDLHLHHVVWLRHNFSEPTFASGEEKTIASMPKGYGLKVAANNNWGLNYMIHSLNARENRQIYITWRLNWVPADSATGQTLNDTRVQWMDVANNHIYPVFDAAKQYDLDGDGKYVFPDDALKTSPGDPGYNQRQNLGPGRTWTLTKPETLIFGGGHLHPGGSNVDLYVARDGDDAGTTAGDDPSEVKHLFRSKAHYYEPAGAISWDVSMGATPRDWRIKLKTGDKVYINVTYDVTDSSWYESMGILPLAISDASDPKAKDPWDDAAAVKEMYDEGGTLTHGRLPENIDKNARKNLGLPDPRDLASKGKKVPADGIDIDNFTFETGGFTATRDFPKSLMRPPTVQAGQTVTFVNKEALFSDPDDQQVWHTVTSCRAPCNKGSGIGYPLAGGRGDFDSGQLGNGTFFKQTTDGATTLNGEVTTGPTGQHTTGGTAATTTTSDGEFATYTTPPLTKPGTYTYFCRLHPLMRGSIRVKPDN